MSLTTCLPMHSHSFFVIYNEVWGNHKNLFLRFFVFFIFIFCLFLLFILFKKELSALISINQILSTRMENLKESENDVSIKLISLIKNYRSEILKVKNNVEYQKLMTKNRGPGDDKQLEKYRLLITSFEAKIKEVETKQAATAVMVANRRPVVPNKYLCHPTNPAVKRIATAYNPAGPSNTNMTVNRSQMKSRASKHEDILQTDELETFLDPKHKPIRRASTSGVGARKVKEPILTKKFERSVNVPTPQQIVKSKFGRGSRYIENTEVPESAVRKYSRVVVKTKHVHPDMNEHTPTATDVAAQKIKNRGPSRTAPVRRIPILSELTVDESTINQDVMTPLALTLALTSAPISTRSARSVKPIEKPKPRFARVPEKKPEKHVELVEPANDDFDNVDITMDNLDDLDL